jgi:hypothetical protein
MSETTLYIVLSWVATFGGVGAYAAIIIRRGRRLTPQVDPQRRRWMHSD